MAVKKSPKGRAGGRGAADGDGSDPSNDAAERPERDLPARSLVDTALLDDDEVELMLANGVDSPALSAYFGDAALDELRALARQAVRTARSADKIFILPGIMGSKLGRKRWPLNDVIWLNPLAIAAGRLDDLRLGAEEIEPLGVILFAYLSLKLRLRIAGYDAVFHPYDWRRSVTELGAELAERIVSQPGRVRIVAHSMGGLVARAALAHDVAGLDRIIMLGTPNFGSYSPVQAFRGGDSTVDKMARLDIVNSFEELTEVFATFRGLIEMIAVPADGAAAGPDLLELDNWPPGGARPPRSALDAAREVRATLLTARDGVDIVLIAGVSQPTIVDAHVQEDEFLYTFNDDGDGTVPLRCCLLPGATTFYVAETHGALPGNSAVQTVLLGLLDAGSVPDAVLEAVGMSRTAPVPRLSRSAARRESELPAVSVDDPRYLASEFIQPAGPLPAIAGAIQGAGPAVSGAPTELTPAQSITVSQRVPFRLEIVLAHGSIAVADAQCYVLGLFNSVEPTGAADAIDALMDNAVSDFVRRRIFSGNVGEIAIIPNGRRAIRASHIALAGLGSIDGFTHKRLQIVGENLARTFVAGRVDDFATVLFGANSGQPAVQSAKSLLLGILRGLRDADREHRFRSLTICEIDEERHNAIWRAFRELVNSREIGDDIEITVCKKTLPEMGPPVGAVRASRTDRTYLLVREDAQRLGQGDGPRPLTASVLTAGARPTIIAGTQPDEYDPAALDEALQQLARLRTPDDVRRVGRRIAELTLTDNVRKALALFKNEHLVVVHDAAGSRIPWEIMMGDVLPSLTRGISHRYEAANLSVAKWLEQRRLGPVLNMLLIADPTEDLPSAKDEGNRIKALVDSQPGLRCTPLNGAAARKDAVIRELQSGAYDVVHYAGHAFFDEAEPARSGILCADHKVLSGSEVATLNNLPTLMFFNACEAARIRTSPAVGGHVAAASASNLRRDEQARRNIGFAEALLRGGVANFVGTYWPVQDDAAGLCAKIFYPALLAGRSINDALGEARRALEEAGHADWADYVFYGDPDFTLKEASSPAPLAAAG